MKAIIKLFSVDKDSIGWTREEVKIKTKPIPWILWLFSTNITIPTEYMIYWENTWQRVYRYRNTGLDILSIKINFIAGINDCIVIDNIQEN